MIDWNDLRYFLAVAPDGSTSGAARAVGVNQSTVSKRRVATSLKERALAAEDGAPLLPWFRAGRGRATAVLTHPCHSTLK